MLGRIQKLEEKRETMLRRLEAVWLRPRNATFTAAAYIFSANKDTCKIFARFEASKTFGFIVIDTLSQLVTEDALEKNST